MPIGLVTGALVLGVLALFLRRSTVRFSSRHCLVLALLFMVPAVLSGIMDWQHFLGGVWTFPIKAKLGLGAVLFLLLVWGILLSREAERNGSLLLICFLALCTSGGLGYFGGEIVFGGRAPESDLGHKAGEIVFRNNCSMCHPYGANIFSPERPIIQSPLLGSFQVFLPWLRDPVAPMPPFAPERMPDGQAKALYDYVTEIWGEHEHEEQPTPRQPLPPSEPFESDPTLDGGPLAPKSEISV